MPKYNEPSDQYQNGWNAAKQNATRIPDNCTDHQEWIEGFNARRRFEAQNMVREWQSKRMMNVSA